MNPPSALHGAMSRDRKPFTYTPGGLDLSEIKSERMAQRLMRNAMNPGVPEKPISTIQSPPMPSTPVAVPNFNCLPVQVFPAFNLPANPKSLLRTRSIPDQSREPPNQNVPQPSYFANHTKPPVAEYYDTFTKPTQPYSSVNNNRPASMYEYDSPANTFSLPRNYASDSFTQQPAPPLFLSQNIYDNGYLWETPKTELQFEDERQTVNDNNLSKEKDLVNDKSEKSNFLTDVDQSLKEAKIESEVLKSDGSENATNEKREVKVVKTVNQETKSEVENADQNGVTEAELTVKLPTKKVGAKTETKVEIEKKILPDGTVEEVKITTTKTTIDGKTEIKTQTEKRILPKEEVDEEIEEEEEEESCEISAQEVEEKQNEEINKEKSPAPKENGEHGRIVKTEERSESTTTTTKKIVVEQDKEEPVEDEEEVVEEEVVEEEEIEEAEPVTVVIKKPTEKSPEPEEKQIEEIHSKEEAKEEENIVEGNKEIEKTEEIIEEDVQDNHPEKQTEKKEQEKEESEVEEEEENEEGQEIKVSKPIEPIHDKEDEKEHSVQVDKTPTEERKSVTAETVAKVNEEVKKEVIIEKEITEKPIKEDISVSKDEPQEDPVKHEIKHEIKLEYDQPKQESTPQPEIKVPLREPSIPLEKVEDVEIKPIGPAEMITKSRIENTEIITADKPTGLCTEYNRIENIITVNRTTKTLDQAYENITQQGVPTMKTYIPPSIDRISTSPLPTRPYQPVYPPETTTERRHSLLLERLSVERQMPTDYQYNTTTSNQIYEQQRQWSQEPQAEVLTVSNVKPSSINQNNQQWYQQTARDNVIYNNVSSAPTASSPAPPAWYQPKSQSQPTYKPQPTYSPQPTYQATYQTSTQTQYKPTQAETVQDRSTNTYTTYTPKPTWASTVESVPTVNAPLNQYSYISKDTTDSYKETSQYTSSYVPPPWEQDSNYATNNSQSYYQPPSLATCTPTSAPLSSQTWKPTPTSKFSKPPPKAYIPPAPNQSFVKPVIVEPPRLPGRKTYYSEYERRYITVPESNYIPTETKYQPQPDPSPQYYYDNNEPTETVEHEWRKELREFTQKTSQAQTQTETNVKPPWEADQSYAKTSTYAPTPTWSQTVRPSSWRERSFESEYVSQEWPKTNTLGRGRPLSSYSKPESTISERTRGVSVDRYNPNSYQSPVAAEHPPVQSHTLTTPAPHAYHNPNVPAYHTRASAESREQPASYQHPRTFREPKASPLQSRSFKYLQWITGTED